MCYGSNPMARITKYEERVCGLSEASGQPETVSAAGEIFQQIAETYQQVAIILWTFFRISLNMSRTVGCRDDFTCPWLWN